MTQTQIDLDKLKSMKKIAKVNNVKCLWLFYFLKDSLFKIQIVRASSSESILVCYDFFEMLFKMVDLANVDQLLAIILSNLMWNDKFTLRLLLQSNQLSGSNNFTYITSKVVPESIVLLAKVNLLRWRHTGKWFQYNYVKNVCWQYRISLDLLSPERNVILYANPFCF